VGAAAAHRGVETELRLQRDSIAPGDRVVLVDDWLETGCCPTRHRRLRERGPVALVEGGAAMRLPHLV
jgi:adenine phosphoribosyltransferase